MENIEQIIKRNRELLLNRDPEANKGTYGKLLLIAGSRGMAGAACLAAKAAFRAGIGMVKVFGPECNRAILQISLPEAMYAVSDPGAGIVNEQELADSIRWADYVIAGPGLSRSEEAKTLIAALYSETVLPLLQEKKLLILDADALNLIAESGRDPGALCGNTVITPHVGEMSRLCGKGIREIKADPEGTAADYSRQYGVTVVLKDAVTVVALPPTARKQNGGPETESAETIRIQSGCGAMAKAGSGDVLCGFLAGTAAVLKGNTGDAVPAGVWLHGCAGCIAAEKKGCHSILAGDIADAAGEAIKHCANL